MARERLKPSSKRDPERQKLRDEVRRGGGTGPIRENIQVDSGAYYYFSAFLAERS